MPDKYGEGQDWYCYPGSDVLINLLGIIDSASLNQAEVEFTRLALVSPLVIALSQKLKSFLNS
ncbi:hypothetical protein RugamoR57_08660 [Duganella caerulea]|uniref:hypothetical protein n=1 Tax=Duganella caerulea TaxID=2885762 RepID=UPI0030E905F0